MFGLGTIVNTAAIILGGVLGTAVGKALSAQMQKALIAANGLCVLFIGMQGALSKMMEQDSTIMIIVCFCAGTLAGEWMDIEGHLESFGQWLKKISRSQSDQGFVSAFISASLTVCVGAMAIIGSLEDGISGNSSILFTKSLLDFIIIMTMASSMGKGCIFAALPVFILQFSITILAFWISPWLSDEMLFNISLTGNMMIFCVGLNLIWPNTIRVANMLPVLVFAALAALFL